MGDKSLSFRQKYQDLIVELSKSADMFSEIWIRTGEYSAYKKYQSYVKIICDLKDMIVEEEAKQEKDNG
jgi:hypothetical protein